MVTINFMLYDREGEVQILFEVTENNVVESHSEKLIRKGSKVATLQSF